VSDTFHDCPNPHGFVNSRVAFSDRDGQRLIFVNSQAYYTYDLDDKITARCIWTQIQIGSHASFVEIADATGIPLRTLQSWKARFRQGGFEELIDKSILGRPRQLTSLVEAQILNLINKGHSHDEVARKLGLSGSRIDRAVDTNKSTTMARQALPKQDDFAWEEAPAIDPQEQVAPAEQPSPEESQALSPSPQNDSPESKLSKQPTAAATQEQPAQSP
jgi:transposase